MDSYEPEKIEKKWQKIWEEEKIWAAVDCDTTKPKFYILDMFPYPSAEGLHVGHPKGYTATDVIARYMRMKGYNVLHPMGFDAFGLPAENYAMKTGIHPAIVTKKNIDNIRRQIKSLGLSYDWDREIDTTDPEYYRWSQWIFIQLFKRGLAYETVAPINFCTSCKTGLANEEVKAGACIKCGSEVIRKNLRQWALRITAYAERLLKGLDELDWPENIKTMQREWMGKSYGADILFPIHDPPAGIPKNIRVYTTRPDTLFGATYMVLAPEHPLVLPLTKPERRQEVEKYIEAAKRKSDLVRTGIQKEKTGLWIGSYCINPLTGKKIPIWIADYVLMSYGTGAIMAVPAHDQRDYEFAKKYNLEIIYVVKPNHGSPLPEDKAFVDEGIAINSGQFNGLKTSEFIPAIIKYLEEKSIGEGKVRYKLRDWLFSRQRYWGEPIPIVHCQQGCGVVPLPEESLPLLLPEVEKYQPTGTGESPLAAIQEWVNTTCPRCGGKALRETNTMPQWAGSCWYYLRYIDPHNRKKLVDPEKEKYWMPVDLYIGGAEHAVLHLLYARFWHMFLYDIGVVSTPEPFKRLRNQGMILGFSYRYWEDEEGRKYSFNEVVSADETGERKVGKTTRKTLIEKWVPPHEVERGKDGNYYRVGDNKTPLEQVIEKMSKSRGNVINPDDIVKKYGADVLRLYEMFMGPLDASCPWSTEGIEGVARFINRAWKIFSEKPIVNKPASKQLERVRHQSIKKVTQDIERFNFNTAISQLMVYLNRIGNENEIPQEDAETFILLLSPFAPHFTEEIWEKMGKTQRILHEKWPRWIEEKTKEETITLAVQVNGKVRGKIQIDRGTQQETIKEKALSLPNVQKHIEGKSINKIVIVRNIVNIVAK